MSIGLFIRYRSPQKEDRLVSIASDYIFSKHWKPICEELHLRWVPRFQNGWMLSVQDIPHILAELNQLQRYLTCGQTHAEISHHMLARISVLMRELNEVYKNLDADAFVGSPCQPARRDPVYRRADLNAHRSAPVRPSIRAESTLVAVPEVLRAALESAAPADRLIDPLPGTARTADDSPPPPKMAWLDKLRLMFGQGSDSVPRSWRTALELK